MIRNSNEFNDIIQNLNNRNYNDVLNKLKTLTLDDSNNSLIIKLFASIYFQKKIF